MTASNGLPNPKPRGARRRGLPALIVLLGAALSASAAFMPWWQRSYHDPLTGELRVTIDGGAVAVALVPLALVVLAGLGAALISRGIVRRIVGIVVAAAGVGSIVATAIAGTHHPDAEFAARLIRPAAPISAAEVVWAALILSVVGGVAEAVGGVLVARGSGRDRVSSVTYSPPAVQREAAQREATQRAVARQSATRVVAPNPSEAIDENSVETAADATDPAEWWRSLDAGVDPTDDAG
ncbi:MAG: Trp biosynthesis-associated membrane protein [Nakamurella sp.]